MDKATNPGDEYQYDTQMPAHHGRVVQGAADGNIAVVGHDGEQEHLRSTHKMEEKKLSDAASKGYDLALRQEVNQHLGGSDGGIPDIQEGQVGQQEIHG